MKNIFISGGSSGLGLRLTVDYLQQEEAVVSTFYRNSRALEGLARTNNNLIINKLDLNSIEEFEIAQKQVDILILSAGVIRNKLFVKETVTEFSSLINKNLTANFKLMKKFVPKMRKSCNPHIVIISSLSAKLGTKGQASYSASKAGLIGLAKSAAKELGRYNIKVNIIFPGFMRSRQTLEFGKEIEKTYQEANALNRLNTLAEISSFIQILANTQNISGQIFNLDSRITS